MDDSLDTLRDFTRTMAEPDRDLNTFGGPVLHYGLFVRQILNARRPSFLQQRDIDEATRLASGEALAPWDAAACMDDRTRTAAFIRGSIQAVESALENSSHRPLHLVEAGCGPLGTLILPLLARFDRNELVVSLIDLHQESIECVEVLLDHFGFLPRIRQLVCGDATSVDLDSPVDLVLSETMNTALSQEPQVAITRALLRRHPDALLIPQSIRIDCALLDIDEEISHFPPRAGDRETLATVFELNRKTALDLEDEDGFLPAAKVTLPDSIGPGLTPCLITAIQVFEATRLGDYETQISHPAPLLKDDGSLFEPGSTLQFSYRMTDFPGLTWQLAAE